MAKIIYLAGMGICDEKDVSLRAVETLKKCDIVFAEKYTNLMKEGTLERLEKIIGKKIILLGREEVEGEKIILEAFEKENKAVGEKGAFENKSAGEKIASSVALLVPGDPMTATTHNSLLQSAKEKGIETKIIHSSSIFTAGAGAAGLQIYKFGKTATITYWRKNYEPTSFMDIVFENMGRGAHTLCLLDIDMELGAMKPSVALEIMKKAQGQKKGEKESEGEMIGEKKIGKEIIGGNTKIFVLWHVGWKDEKIWAGEIKEYKFSGKNEREGPAVIIIPGKMHFAEEEGWKNFCGK